AFSAGANSQGDSISQRFFTNVGQVYMLDFDAAIAGVPDSGANLQLEVQVNGTTSNLDQTITPPVPGVATPSAAQFQHYHFVFTADATVTTLKFLNIGLGNGSADQVLDSVSVTATGGPTPTPTPIPLTNADFETGPFGPNAITGWTVT